MLEYYYHERERGHVSCLKGLIKMFTIFFVFQYDTRHQKSCKALNILPGMCYRLLALWAVKERRTAFACPLPSRR